MVLLIFFYCMMTGRPRGYPSIHNPSCRLKDSQRDFFYRSIHFFGEIIVDATRLMHNLFSVDSAKIATLVTPFYLITRSLDEQIQKPFYDPAGHKNCNQLPRSCHDFAKNSVAIPMVGLSSLAIFATDSDLALTARMLAIGLPFVQSGKDIIKSLRFTSCLRPWNENFCQTERSSGGFPSGHIANISYMAMLFGMRHGLRWAIPLTALGIFVAADFLNCNRHYLSQLVAGAGLGVIFAVAASKVVDTKIMDHWSINRADQGTGLKIAYLF